ncbi:MAG: D-glycerate dehydrogenase [bacterium]|nr:D-glycerate dehydrogenase [bacterium]
MPKVFITTEIPDVGIALLKAQGYEIEIGPLERAKGADALLSQLKDRIDGALLDAIGPQLKVVANYSVGYDNFDLQAAKERGVLCTNTPGVQKEVVAEHAVALLLAVARRVVESDRYMRAGKFKGFEPDLLVGAELAGKTLGLIGHGRIGCRAADILQKGIGMNVMYYDSVRDEQREKQCGIVYASLEEVLGTADAVTIHVSLSASTRHLLGAKELALMKPTAYLVNTSRGAVIDEKELVKALQEKRIAGAALDVFEEEPNLSPGLVDLENVVLTPHVASASREARSKMAELAAQNIIAALSGATPPNLVQA